MKLLTIFSASLISFRTRCYQERFSTHRSSVRLSAQRPISTAVPCQEIYKASSVLEQQYFLSFDDVLSNRQTSPGLSHRDKPLLFQKSSSHKHLIKDSRYSKTLPQLNIDPITYNKCCFDRYSRTLPNPLIASHALIIENEAYFYTPPLSNQHRPHQKTYINNNAPSLTQNVPEAPKYAVLNDIYDASSDCRHSKYIGRTKSGLTMYGTYALDLTVYCSDFKKPVPAKLVSFYPLEKEQPKPVWSFQETIDPLFSFANWGQKIKELYMSLEKKLFYIQDAETTNLKKRDMSKPFPFKVIDKFEIDLESLSARKKIYRRKPSQVNVMGHSSSKEMVNLLNQPLAEILNTEIRSFVASCVTNYGLSKPEWLHLVGFGCTPMWMNPQTKNNLVASSESLNTEQMITECILQSLGQRAYELGYQNTDLRLSIQNSFFELIPTTNIASYMSFNTKIELPSSGHFIETHQNYASLQHIPLRHMVDVGAACVIFSKFLEGQPPCHKTAIRGIQMKNSEL